MSAPPVPAVGAGNAVDRVADRRRRRGRGSGEHQEQRQSNRRCCRGTRHRQGAFSGLGADAPFGASSGEGPAPCGAGATVVPAAGADVVRTFETNAVCCTVACVCCCRCDLLVALAVRVSRCARSCATGGLVEAVERGGRNRVRKAQGTACSPGLPALAASPALDPKSCVARTAVRAAPARTTAAKAAASGLRIGASSALLVVLC